MIENVAHVKADTTRLILNATDWTPAYVGAANLPGRKWLLIQNKSNVRMAYSPSNSKVYKDCPELGVGDKVVLPISDSLTFYLKAQTGAVKYAAVMELA